MNILSRLNPATFGPFQWINVAWLALTLYWVITWFSAKRPARAESSRERWTHLAFLLVGAILLMKDDWPWPLLRVRLYPYLPWIAWTGAALALFGAAFAIWARITIGSNWSAEVQIKEGHQLIRSGPYKFIRHPIYTGILLMLVGDALALGEVRGVLAFVLITIGFARKARKEESYLASEFGPAFDEHIRRTGFFLPRFS
ncbi:MAG: isoprenylcysteine carboxylmethyltransferase family protein [Candidatus Acidiferrales bacterium]